jgi:hypothetical protein
MLDLAVARLPSRDVYDTPHTLGVMTVKDAESVSFWVGL